MKRLISEIGNVPFLRKVSEISKIMKQMRAVYSDYPESEYFWDPDKTMTFSFEVTLTDSGQDSVLFDDRDIDWVA